MYGLLLNYGAFSIFYTCEFELTGEEDVCREREREWKKEMSPKKKGTVP